MRFLLFTTVFLGFLSCGDQPEADQLYQLRMTAIGGSFERGNYGIVIDQMQLFLQEYPEAAEGWTLLGHAYSQRLKRDAAKEAYFQALEVDPDQYQAMTGLGSIFLVKRDYEQAMNYFREAVAINPEFDQAWSSMIIVALKLYQDDLALECAEKALNLNQNDATIAANAAVAYHINNNFQKRDQLTLKARELGIPENDLYTLDRIFGGEISVRGDLPAQAGEPAPPKEATP